MQEIEFEVADGKIILPLGAPFNGKPVLIKLAEGWCEARWEHQIITQTQDGRIIPL